MKKSFWVILLFLTFTSLATGQISSPFSLYAGGAVSFPSSPDTFKDSFKTGLHGSLGLGFTAIPSLQVVAKAEYHTFKFNFEDETGMKGGTNKIWLFGADGRFSIGVPAAPMKPFILGGAGMASIRQSDFSGGDPLATSILNSAVSENQTKFYYNVGAGVDLKSGPAWSLFAQVRYVSIATEGEASVFVPLTLGLKFF